MAGPFVLVRDDISLQGVEIRLGTLVEHEANDEKQECLLVEFGRKRQSDRLGSVGGRPLFPRTFSEADRQLSARLRHAGSPSAAEPDIRLRAHLGLSVPAAGISEGDIGSGRNIDLTCATSGPSAKTIPMFAWLPRAAMAEEARRSLNVFLPVSPHWRCK